MILNILKKDNLELIQIDEFYTKSELKKVNKEVKELYKFRKSSERTKSAIDDNNKALKSGTGIDVYDLYGMQANESHILRCSKKIFHHKCLEYLISNNVNYRHILHCNKDNLLLNYYTQTQEYKSHFDYSTFTIIVMLKIGNFTGGDLFFKDNDVQIDFKENRAVIFPGCAYHEAKPIYGDGIRATVAHFINHKG
tara:strand:+ start:54 stop:638 length:585 start_codon:yes stop_codon:yes gene_type:complete